MSVQPEELVNIAKRVLKLMGVTGFTEVELTYAMKVDNEWKVNFKYTTTFGLYRSTGSFKAGAETGEIKGMWLDRTWK